MIHPVEGVAHTLGMKHLYQDVGLVVGVLVQMLHPYLSMAHQPAIAFQLGMTIVPTSAHLVCPTSPAVATP